jgi:hypothetical protein
MKKVYLRFFIVSLTCASGSAYSSEQEKYQSALPASMLNQIAGDNGMSAKDVHVVSGSTVKINDIYISAVVFVDSTKNCTVYVFDSGKANPLFNGAPCEFKGQPKVSYVRNGNYPDFIYKIKIFAPSLGAMTDSAVAIYYDKVKSMYCQSQALSDWYFGGNKKINPDLSDGRCKGEGM